MLKAAPVSRTAPQIYNVSGVAFDTAQMKKARLLMMMAIHTDPITILFRLEKVSASMCIFVVLWLVVFRESLECLVRGEYSEHGKLCIVGCMLGKPNDNSTRIDSSIFQVTEADCHICKTRRRYFLLREHLLKIHRENGLSTDDIAAVCLEE